MNNTFKDYFDFYNKVKAETNTKPVQANPVVVLSTAEYIKIHNMIAKGAHHA